MSEIFTHRRNEKSFGMNLTPIIDVVFLLIIFFVVVFQFSSAVPADVELPENCNFANQKEIGENANYILSVQNVTDGDLSVSLGDEKLKGKADIIATEVTGLINKNLSLAQSPLLIVRIDKNILYTQAQYILKAISESQAEQVQLAVLGESGN